MKIIKISISILVLFLVSSIINAQKTKAMLVFKDGTEKQGFAKLLGSESVKYRTNKEAIAINYHFSDLEYVEIYDGDSPSIYKYIMVEGKDKAMVLKEIVKGNVCLYTQFSQGYAPAYSGMPGGGAPMVMSGNFYSIKNLYVLKDGEKAASHLGSNQLFTKNFKEAASIFFKDCPPLVEKIQNKEYKKKEIKAIVEFYNANCK